MTNAAAPAEKHLMAIRRAIVCPAPGPAHTRMWNVLSMGWWKGGMTGIAGLGIQFCLSISLRDTYERVDCERSVGQSAEKPREYVVKDRASESSGAQAENIITTTPYRFTNAACITNNTANRILKKEDLDTVTRANASNSNINPRNADSVSPRSLMGISCCPVWKLIPMANGMNAIIPRYFKRCVFYGVEINVD
jgi:hypothetical protein